MAPALIVLGLILGGYLKGYSDADRSKEIDELTRNLSTAQHMLDLERSARDADAAAAAEQAKRLEALTTKTTDLQEYANALEDAGRECLAGADTDRLRNLWN
ncbi:hypothetical protein [Neorhizobium sp. S3-V5DH]|uniref:hypothetical protein n=1 Tax=Neorhizobium sp. S3-V5DH TaxID=2485166 RepID=UPI00104CA302|nr:hypothetical protein [Neorhizobium sp. S3-V5DH]